MINVCFGEAHRCIDQNSLPSKLVILSLLNTRIRAQHVRPARPSKQKLCCIRHRHWFLPKRLTVAAMRNRHLLRVVGNECADSSAQRPNRPSEWRLWALCGPARPGSVSGRKRAVGFGKLKPRCGHAKRVAPMSVSDPLRTFGNATGTGPRSVGPVWPSGRRAAPRGWRTALAPRASRSAEASRLLAILRTPSRSR